jgi:chemotaxis protein CheY-P-specific phosphatase CheC
MRQPTTDTPQLAAVVLELLGDLAFMVSDDEPGRGPAGRTWMQGEISYEGRASGRLRCWCTREFGVRLAANLLGIEVADAAAQLAAQDAVREFMNVLCGQVVTAWHGTEGVFRLAIPAVSDCAQEPPRQGSDRQRLCRFSIEGEVLVVAYEQPA